MSNVPPPMLTKPFVESSSLFDLMPSPPASMSKTPSRIFTLSRPRRPSSTALMLYVPDATIKSSFEHTAWRYALVTFSVPDPFSVRSQRLNSVAYGSSESSSSTYDAPSDRLFSVPASKVTKHLSALRT